MVAKPKHPRAHRHARPPHEIGGADSLLLDEVGAEKRSGVSRYQLRALRDRGEGPVIVRLGRSVRYRPEDLSRWIDEHRVAPRDFAAAKRKTARAEIPAGAS